MPHQCIRIYTALQYGIDRVKRSARICAPNASLDLAAWVPRAALVSVCVKDSAARLATSGFIDFDAVRNIRLIDERGPPAIVKHANVAGACPTTDGRLRNAVFATGLAHADRRAAEVFELVGSDREAFDVVFGHSQPTIKGNGSNCSGFARFGQGLSRYLVTR